MPDAVEVVEEEPSRVARRLGPRAIHPDLQSLAKTFLPLGRRATARGKVELAQHDREIRGELAGERERGPRDALPEKLAGAVEVLDRFGQVAGVHQGLPDVPLERRLLGGITPLAVDGEVEARGLTEVVQRLARGGGASRLVARLEEILLRLLRALGPRVVV